MDLKRRRPSAGVAVGLTALVVALGGTAHGADAVSAARKLVQGSDLATGAVTSSKVKDGSLLSRDFRPGQLPRGAQGDPGPVGPRGATGATGAAGATGATGARGPSDAFSTFRDAQYAIPNGGAQQTVLTLGDLPAGRYAISAKAVLNHNENSERYVTCRLGAESDEDLTVVGLGPQSGFLDVDGVSLNVVHEFGAAGTVVLSCNNSGATPSAVLASERKITAIRVASLSNVAAATP